ncbi:MAG: GlxA family transcriptional regulator [Proteobacteria bacterium]|nr:GlxA family transcriptional regulator [Pseudomonadota bacterium]
MARFDVAFLLVPRFSMIALYGAVEPLRVANRFAGEVFSWRFVSVDGAPVAASNGIPVSVGGDLASLGKPTMAMVAASYEPEAGISRPMLGAIRKLARQKVQLAAIDTGPFLLAEAGVLDGYRATCHWESLPGFRESFPQVIATEALYEKDRDRLTSAGGAAAIDMMLGWIGDQMGQGLSVMVADQLIHFRNQGEQGQVRAPAQMRYATRDPRLLAVIAAMEQNMEEPLSAPQLAGHAGVSVRSMERLFRDGLRARPMGVYRRIRLERAERLLTYSHMSVRDVSLATGFSTLAEFSRAFRDCYGRPPSMLRRTPGPLAKGL